MRNKDSAAYRIWKGLRQRCKNPNNSKYHRYGGRGITVCARWDDFLTFADDMGPRPKGHTLDRIDNDGNYTPENCRWALPREQSRNTSSNVVIEYQGRRMCLRDWCAELGVVHFDTAYQRISKQGWDPVDAITMPKYSKRKDSLTEWYKDELAKIQFEATDVGA